MPEKFFKLEQITNNPYRDVAKFPLNTKRVDMLKTSIIENGLWQPLPARKQNGHIQLACGHHRVQAIKELGEYQYLKRPKLIKGEVPLLIAPYTDAQIIKVMLDENFGWEHSTDILLEGIRAARLFLKAQLEAYDKLANFKKQLAQICARCQAAGQLKTQKAYEVARGMSVGERLLMAYLGPNWAQLKQWEVREVLAADKDIEEGKLHEGAYKEFKTIGNARKFRQQVAPKGKAAEVRDPVPVEEQAELVPKARKAAAEGGTKEERRTNAGITKVVAEHNIAKNRKAEPLPKPDPIPDAGTIFLTLVGHTKENTKAVTKSGYNIIKHVREHKLEVSTDHPAEVAEWEAIITREHTMYKKLLPVLFGKEGKAKLKKLT